MREASPLFRPINSTPFKLNPAAPRRCCSPPKRLPWASTRPPALWSSSPCGALGDRRFVGRALVVPAAPAQLHSSPCISRLWLPACLLSSSAPKSKPSRTFNPPPLPPSACRPAAQQARRQVVPQPAAGRIYAGGGSCAVTPNQHGRTHTHGSCTGTPTSTGTRTPTSHSLLRNALPGMGCAAMACHAAGMCSHGVMPWRLPARLPSHHADGGAGGAAWPGHCRHSGHRLLGRLA